MKGRKGFQFTPVPDYSKIPETSIAYIAGMFDGDGNIRFFNHKGRGNKYPSFRIANTDKFLMNWLTKTIEGSRITKFQRPPHKDIYYFELASLHAVVALCNRILPYLIVKKARVEKVLKVIKANRYGYKINTKEACRRLLAGASNKEVMLEFGYKNIGSVKNLKGRLKQRI
jgi:hypothetical protein